MKITINYLAQLKQAAGIPSENLEVETPCSVQSLVAKIAENRGEPLRSFLVDSQGSLRSSILLIVGEEQVHWESSFNLKEGDVVTFLSPLAGG